MVRGIVGVVLLVAGTGWLPFAAGFVLVKVMDPRQYDRMAFHNGLGLALVGAGPLLVAWFLLLLTIVIVHHRFPRLAATLAALGGATVAGFVASGAIGGSLGGYGGLVVILVLPAAVLLLLATLVAHPILRIALGEPVKPRTPPPASP